MIRTQRNTLVFPKVKILICSLLIGIAPARSQDYCNRLISSTVGTIGQNYKSQDLSRSGSHSLTEALARPDSIIFVPDVHGNLTAWTSLLHWISSRWPQWLGIEIPLDLQPIIDVYQNSPMDSVQFLTARMLLRNYLNRSWDSFFHMQGWNSSESPIELALLTAKLAGVRIIAIDTPDLHRAAGRAEDMMSRQRIVERNLVWASRVGSIPGRGLVFGGRGHFELFPQENVQDFLRAMNRPFAFFDVTGN